MRRDPQPLEANTFSEAEQLHAAGNESIRRSHVFMLTGAAMNIVIGLDKSLPEIVHYGGEIGGYELVAIAALGYFVGIKKNLSAIRVHNNAVRTTQD